MTYDEIKAEMDWLHPFYGKENLIKVIIDLGGVTHILSSHASIEKYGYTERFGYFNDDDWDYLIAGNHYGAVVEVAEELFVCDYSIKEINGEVIAVTYHA
jgi:hypothetical protein